jgi:hypothetical protein
MSDNKVDNAQEQKGVGRLASALGQDSLDTVKLGITAAAIGAAVGASMHNKEAHKIAVEKITEKIGINRAVNIDAGKVKLFKDVTGAVLKDKGL